MKIWISKYALSSGVTEHECEPPKAGSAYVYPLKQPFDGYYSFVVGRHAHTTREEAVKAAEAARLKKIALIRKQLDKLEKMSF
jgi:hypothetical protein